MGGRPRMPLLVLPSPSTRPSQRRTGRATPLPPLPNHRQNTGTCLNGPCWQQPCTPENNACFDASECCNDHCECACRKNVGGDQRVLSRTTLACASWSGFAPLLVCCPCAAAAAAGPHALAWGRGEPRPPCALFQPWQPAPALAHNRAAICVETGVSTHIGVCTNCKVGGAACEQDWECCNRERFVLPRCCRCRCCCCCCVMHTGPSRCTHCER